MCEAQAKEVAAVIGVGGGLDAALARRFETEYKVALGARSAAIELVAHRIWIPVFTGMLVHETGASARTFLW
ncbi:MAG: hypothetical protein AB7G75_02295 [Candidatus Binatia bacterium]